MRNYKKLTTIIAIFVILMPTLLSGCTSEPVRLTPMKSGNYDISIFFGSVQDPIVIDEMINKYNKDSGISIEAIVSDNLKQDKRYLNRLLESDNPPVGFVVADEEQLNNIIQEGRIKNLLDIDEGISIEKYPYKIDGYGLIIDKRLIPEIAEGSSVDNFTTDLIAADYNEWSAFVSNLGAYIYNDATSAYKLNGNEYTFPEKKGALISEVNGTFAISGSDYTTINTKLLNVIFSNIDLEPLDGNLEHEKPVVGEGFDAYFEVLDTMTSNIAGRFAAGIRGKDFVDEKKFSRSQVLEIFGKGKSVFTIAASEDYEELRNIDAEKAMNLAMIPIKIPTTADVILESNDGRLINSSIPLTSSYYLYANAGTDAKQQTMLVDFIKWLSIYDADDNNSLEADVLKYLERGDVAPFLIEGSLASFVERIEKDRLLNEFLVTAVWDSKIYSNFIDLLNNTWAETR